MLFAYVLVFGLMLYTFIVLPIGLVMGSTDDCSVKRTGYVGPAPRKPKHGKSLLTF